MAKGDLAICYASVWQSVFAVVEVTSDPEEDPERDRWRWSFGIRPLLALDDLDRSIPAEEVGIFAKKSEILVKNERIDLTSKKFTFNGKEVNLNSKCFFG